MKSTLQLFIAFLCLTSVILNVGLYVGYNSLEQRLIKSSIPVEDTEFDNPIIIWNDDLEAIPVDGSLITLEKTINDTIYIGHYDKLAKIN